MRNFTCVAIGIAMLTLGSCASITDGTSQTIIFNLEPQTVTCSVTREGDGVLGNVSSTNNSLSVSKSKDDLIITCSAKEYKTKTVRMVSSTQASGVIGGAFLDLGIVDMMTGAMWKYQGSTNIALEKI